MKTMHIVFVMVIMSSFCMHAMQRKNAIAGSKNSDVQQQLKKAVQDRNPADVCRLLAQEKAKNKTKKSAPVSSEIDRGIDLSTVASVAGDVESVVGGGTVTIAGQSVNVSELQTLAQEVATASPGQATKWMYIAGGLICIGAGVTDFIIQRFYNDPNQNQTETAASSTTATSTDLSAVAAGLGLWWKAYTYNSTAQSNAEINAALLDGHAASQ